MPNEEVFEATGVADENLVPLKDLYICNERKHC